jgi:hypothetical protein
MSNALKFTPKGGSVTITVRISESIDDLQLASSSASQRGGGTGISRIATNNITTFPPWTRQQRTVSPHVSANPPLLIQRDSPGWSLLPLLRSQGVSSRANSGAIWAPVAANSEQSRGGIIYPSPAGGAESGTATPLGNIASRREAVQQMASSGAGGGDVLGNPQRTSVPGTPIGQRRRRPTGTVQPTGGGANSSKRFVVVEVIDSGVGIEPVSYGNHRCRMCVFRLLITITGATCICLRENRRTLVGFSMKWSSSMQIGCKAAADQVSDWF